MMMARTKTEERQLASEAKSAKKKIPVRYPFNFVEKRHNRKSLEGRFQSQIQIAISGTENTVRTYRLKIFTESSFRGFYFRDGSGSFSRDHPQRTDIACHD